MLVHLVKLINTSDSVISKHERTTFKHEFISDRILVDTSSQTDTGTTTTGSISGSRSNLM